MQPMKNPLPIWPVYLAALTIALVLLFPGCMTRPQKGGTSGTKIGAHFQATLAQSENPQQPSSQTVERTVEIEPGLTLPPDQTVSYILIPSGTNATNTVVVPARVREVTRTTTTIGAAQKDTAREIAAKLKAVAPAFYVGIACILAAGALFYFGWHTPAVIAAATGAGLMLFSHLIATEGHLMLIVAIAGLAILAVFRAYEKGKLDHILPDALDKFPAGNKPPQ